VTLAFTDIEGSSELSERHGAAFEPLRQAQFHLLREAAARHQGYEVVTAGDSLFVAFARVSDAVYWAADAQRALQSYAWPAETGPVRIRIGLHTGEPFVSHEAHAERVNYYGAPVNRAARIEAAAHGGQVLVSQATHDLFRDPSPTGEGITFVDRGTHRLKGVGTERLWQVLADGLPRDFPPPATLAIAARHNLPPIADTFVGREHEVADLRGLLTATEGTTAARLVTLTGFGGMGKSRVARQAADACADEFEGGVWWVALDEARTGDEMLRHTAEGLRLPLQPALPLRDQVHGFLRDRSRLLLVLDNTEQVAEAATVVRDLLAQAPGLSCLVTSRRALGLRAETVVEIRPLPPLDAQRLFADRARACRDDFRITDENADDVAELCRRLEGVPLAVELAAARITGMSPRQMIARLSERFRLLQSRAPDLPPRQRALRAAIDWSHDLLGEEDKALFAQLSVFAGSFTLDDAEAVCETFDVFEGVMTLRGHSLLSSDTDAATQETRFSLLESLREYAGEKLRDAPDAEQQALAERHARHFLARAEAELARFRTAGEADALRRLDINSPNLRAAAAWAENADPTLNARLNLALGRLLQRRGFQSEAVAPIEAGIAAARRLSTSDAAAATLLARLLAERAGLHLDLRQPAEARALAADALTHFRQHGEAAGEADAENLLGQAALDEKRYDDARTHFARALDLRETLGSRIEAAIVRNNLGLVEYSDPDGDRDKAAEHLTEALRVRRPAGDWRGVAAALNNLGNLAFARQDWAEAERAFAETLEHERALRHPFGVARALNNLGEVAEERGEYPKATRLYVAAEHLFREVKHDYAVYSADRLSALSGKAGLTEAQIATLRAVLHNKPLEAVGAWATADGGSDAVLSGSAASKGTPSQ